MRMGQVSPMEVVDEFCDLLQTHANRDKVTALTCYVLKFWGSTSGRTEVLAASGKIAACRSVLRLFDDAAALKLALAYGLGRHDGLFWGTLGVSSSLFTLAYLQAEKAMFLIDTGMWVVDNDLAYRIRTAHKVFWTFTAFIAFLRSIRALHKSAQDLKSPKQTRCAPARFTQACLTTTKLILDTVHVVCWLPPGYLWGGLDVRKASGIATLSYILALVIHYKGKRLARSK